MSVKVTIRDTPDGRRFKRMLQELSKLEVRVGFQAGEAQEEDGTDICEVAAYNELGNEPRVSCMPDKYPTSEQHPKPYHSDFF